MPWSQIGPGLVDANAAAEAAINDPEAIQRRAAMEQADRMRTEDLLRSSQLGQAAQQGGLGGIQPIVHHPQLQDNRGPWMGMRGMPPSNLGYPGFGPDPVTHWQRSWQEQEPGDSGRYRHVTEYKDQPGQTFPGHWLEQDGEVSTPMTRGKRHLNNFMQKFAPQ